MTNKEIKVLRVLWDDSYRHPDISEKLYKKLYNVTVSSMHHFNSQWYADENKVVTYSFNAEDHRDFTGATTIDARQPMVVIKDLNDLVRRTNGLTYDYVVMFSLGTMIDKPHSVAQGVCIQYHSNPDFKIAGHIMHTGLWEVKSGRSEFENLFTLHDQTLLISKEAIDSLRNDKFVFNNNLRYHTNEWAKVKRTKENVHDDYTPLKIMKDDSDVKMPMKKRNSFGFGEDLIQYAISKGWEIDNINSQLRGAKKYSYYTNKPAQLEKFIDCTIEELYKSKNIMIEGHYEFLKCIKENEYGCFFAYNNEQIDKCLPRAKYDTFVGVASGYLPWLYLSKYDFADDTKVLFVDINQYALDFQQWFLETYEPYKNQSWEDIVNRFIGLFEEKYKKEFGIDELSVSESTYADRSNAVWKKQQSIIDENWNKIKNFDFDFQHRSLMRSYEVEQFIKDRKRPMVWLSNIFNYVSNWLDPVDFGSYINDIFSANQLVTWTGCAPTGQDSRGPGGMPNTKDKEFYSRKDIPEFDKDKFLEEIQALEENNLFTDHRGGGHPGWSSFVVHGIEWNKTLHYDEYGYKSDRLTPYKFTDKAKEYTPTIVKYFEENKEHFHQHYHRVRVMKLAPGGYIGLHNDNPNEDTWALNMSINNPLGCEMHFWDKDYQYLGEVPWKPGRAFKIRIGLNHMVRNLSNETRYHLIVHGRSK